MSELGIQVFTGDDKRVVAGSRISAVRDTIFANPSVTNCRKVVVHIAASADGYIARPDGDLEWLTSRPAPKGFYGMNTLMRSIDTKVDGHAMC